MRRLNLGGQDFYACCPRGKAILVIGSEGQGISKPVRDAATHHLALPMRGGANAQTRRLPPAS